MELSELVLAFQHLAAVLLSIVFETIIIAKVLLSTKELPQSDDGIMAKRDCLFTQQAEGKGAHNCSKEHYM